MAEYPPYVNAYNGVPTLFEQIKAAAVPPKFTVDFLSTALDMKSSSYRAMIPLLKKLGFIDPANVPTQAYKDFREDSFALYYSLENSIRRLISERLSEKHGANWWNDKVPEGVRKEVEKKQREEKDTTMSIRSEDPLALH